MLRNPGFEQWVEGKPAGWDVRSTADPPILLVSRDTGERHGRAASTRMEVLGRTKWSCYIGQAVDVAPGTLYTLRAWVRAPGDARAFVNVKSADMRTSITVKGSRYQDWSPIEVIFSTGESSKINVLLRLEFQDPKAVAWWDDVHLIEGEVPGEPYNPRMTLKQGPKHRPAPDAHGQWPSERVLYRDELAGAEVWRMTDDPALDWHRYYDCQPWSPDGSAMVFYSSRPGSRGLWLMDADGSHIRPLPVPTEVGRPSSPVWSTEGTHIYVGGQNLAAVDVTTGEARIITSHEEGGWDDLDLSPDGRWLTYGRRERSCWVSSTDGNTHHRLMEGGVDHYRFASADGRTIVCNDAGDTKMWKLTWSPEAGLLERVLMIDQRFSHPDRLPDFSGMVFAFWTDGQGNRACGVDMAGNGFHTAVNAPFCHLSVSNDGALLVGDHGYNQVGVPWVGVGRRRDRSFRKVAYHDSVFASSAGSRHEASQSTHPHPYFSPDDTKFVFNSGLTWTNSEMLVCVWRRPDPPQAVEFSRDRLSWRAPKRCLELRGYNVYVSQNTDGDRRLLNTEPISGTAFAVPGHRGRDLLVTAVEHSGLESQPVGTASTGARTTPLPRPDTASPPKPGGVRVTAAGRYESLLTWTCQDLADVHHFAIYRSDKATFEPSNRTIVGTPKAPLREFRDWGLNPGATYHYKITSVDRWWNESAAATATVTMDAASTVTMALGAESGALSNGMRAVADNRANGGKCVESLTEGDSVATYTFHLERDGEYVIWGRACGPDGHSDSFFVSLDDGPRALWDVDSREYRWSRASDREGSVPTLHQLAAGRHTITVSRREPGARLDGLIVTDDLRSTPR
ncbi:MAG: hypothetical protein HN849_15335 [Victivallales bacterium]|nr:hypothetical protein [Victivallales bacterium]